MFELLTGSVRFVTFTEVNEIGRTNEIVAASIATSICPLTCDKIRTCVQSARIGQHVVTRLGDGVPIAGKLHLEDHSIPVTKHHLGARQVIFPHSTESFVVQFGDFLAICFESLRPVSQCFRVMESQDLHVRHPQALPFRRGENFGHRGGITTGENVLSNPFPRDAWRADVTD